MASLSGKICTLLHIRPEQVAKAGKPVPAIHLPLPHPEVEVQKEPAEGVTEEEGDHVEPTGQDDENRGPHGSGDMLFTSRPLDTSRVLTSLECRPGPLDHHPRPPEVGLSETTQMSQVSSSSEDHMAAASCSPYGDVPPPGRLDPEAAVLSEPTSCCSWLPEACTEAVPGEDHQPSSADSLPSGKKTQGTKPAVMPSRSSLPGPASSRSHMRKAFMPLALLLL
ncbi:putative UPF0607 protein FLJ37424 [Manis javanica]|uniref:putative UPF0607 protein FLJ37424 n=1 Tax=Manis javanica TaxID=9974 RepID=UPI0008130FFB